MLHCYNRVSEPRKLGKRPNRAFTVIFMALSLAIDGSLREQSVVVASRSIAEAALRIPDS